jgi:hypothetical protein
MSSTWKRRLDMLQAAVCVQRCYEEFVQCRLACTSGIISDVLHVLQQQSFGDGWATCFALLHVVGVY